MTSHQEIRKRYLKQFGGLITHPLANGLWNFIESELSSSATKIREEERERVYEELKLWRPVFYQTTVTEGDRRELEKLLLPSEGENNQDNQSGCCEKCLHGYTEKRVCSFPLCPCHSKDTHTPQGN